MALCRLSRKGRSSLVWVGGRVGGGGVVPAEVLVHAEHVELGERRVRQRLADPRLAVDAHEPGVVQRFALAAGAADVAASPEPITPRSPRLPASSLPIDQTKIEAWLALPPPCAGWRRAPRRERGACRATSWAAGRPAPGSRTGCPRVERLDECGVKRIVGARDRGAEVAQALEVAGALGRRESATRCWARPRAGWPRAASACARSAAGAPSRVRSSFFTPKSSPVGGEPLTVEAAADRRANRAPGGPAATAAAAGSRSAPAGHGGRCGRPPRAPAPRAG